MMHLLLLYLVDSNENVMQVALCNCKKSLIFDNIITKYYIYIYSFV